MKTIYLSLWLLALPVFISAQETLSKPEMLQTFDKIIGLENTKIYNGKRYYNIYKVTKDNHNFFTAPDFIKGNVVYDGASFFNTNLKYDTFNDKLIFEPNGDKAFINIELIKDKVESFSFNTHHFVNSKSIIENKDLVNGYLEVLHQTQTLTLYAKRKKTVTERIRGNSLVHLFSNEPSFYIRHADTFSKIKSSKSFRKLFPNFNKELKTEIRENNNRFKKDDEALFLFLTQWLDFKLQTNSSN